MNTKSLLQRNLRWTKTDDAEFVYKAVDPNEGTLLVRLNDFPAEPQYTLLRDGVPIESFDDWPACWHVD